MAGKAYLGQKVTVKQTITLRRTIRFATVGTSSAALICLLLFIGFNSKTSNVIAGKHPVKPDTSRFATKKLFDASDTMLLKFNKRETAADSLYTIKKQKAAFKQIRTSHAAQPATGEDETPPADFINIYPKNTSGVFNIEFTMPGKETFSPKIELLDRRGNVLETKISTPENGKVIESFIMGNNLPNGQYLVRVYINKELFVRQVVLQKEAI